VSDDAAHQCWGTDIACLGLEDRVYVTWCDSRTDPNDLVDDIYLSESVDGGLTWSPDLQINDDPSGNNVRHWDPAIEIFGDFTSLCWNDERTDTFDVYYCTCAAKAQVSSSGDAVGQHGQMMGTPNPTDGVCRFEIADMPSAIFSLAIYDIRGRLIRTLHRTHQAGSAFTLLWDGLDDSGREVPQGVYFVTVRTPVGSAVKKIVVTR
jgi:hypothetical protein